MSCIGYRLNSALIGSWEGLRSVLFPHFSMTLKCENCFHHDYQDLGWLWWHQIWEPPVIIMFQNNSKHVHKIRNLGLVLPHQPRRRKSLNYPGIYTRENVDPASDGDEVSTGLSSQDNSRFWTNHQTRLILIWPLPA